FLIGPIFFAGGVSAFALAISLGYPLGDIAVLVALFTLVLRGVGSSDRLTYLLPALGILCYVAADWGYALGTLQGTYTAATLSVDGFWLCGALIMSLAPLYQLARARGIDSREQSPEPTSASADSAHGSQAPTSTEGGQTGTGYSETGLIRTLLTYAPIL